MLSKTLLDQSTTQQWPIPEIFPENSSYSLASCMDIMLHIYVMIIRFDYIDDSIGLYIMYIDKGMNNVS